jgi:MFS family permease
MISGAATAALVELDPDDDRRRASLFAGLAQSGGSAVGPLLAGVLVQWAPAPRQLSYLAVLAATVVAGLLVLRLPEPAAGAREAWRIQVPRVPREVLGSFLRVSATAGLVWATLSLFLSVVPTYAGDLLDTKNVALLSTVAALSVASSCAAQVAARRFVAAGRPPQALGLACAAHARVARGGGGPRPRAHQRATGAERARAARAPRRGHGRVRRVHLLPRRDVGGRRRPARSGRVALDGVGTCRGRPDRARALDRGVAGQARE